MSVSKVVYRKRQMSDLLYYATTIHLLRQTKNVIPHLIGQNLFLRLIAMLEEFLDHVIAKDICHQLDSIGVKLAEDLVFLVTVGSLELLLNEA